MKYINKGKAPESLEEYKLIPNANYEDMPTNVKEETRTCLHTEQGGICCYCGTQIKNDYTSVIEHLKPKGKSQYHHLQLEYNNLLLSCDGGAGERQGKTRREKRLIPSFCDDKKNDQIIKVSPLDADCESRFMYDEEGYIYALNKDDIDAQDTIHILGLDCEPLVNLRHDAIKPYVDENRSRVEWLETIKFLSERHNGKYLPFCFAVIYYIKEFKIPFAV